MNNALSLISPLTGSLDVNGNDLTAVDEIQLNDAAGNASAAGRLRRNATVLTWHDGTAVRRAGLMDTANNFGVGTFTFGTSAASVLAIPAGTAPTTAPADLVQHWVADRNGAGTATKFVRTEDSGLNERALAVLIQTYDGTERTTTATSSADLSTHVVNIPAGDAFIVTGLFRKTTGHASPVLLGLKVNGTTIVTNFSVTSSTNQVELGVFVYGYDSAWGQGRDTNYTQGSLMAARSGAVAGALTEYLSGAYAAQLPTAAITEIIVTGHVANALNTLAIKHVTVYRVARA